METLKKTPEQILQDLSEWNLRHHRGDISCEACYTTIDDLNAGKQLMVKRRGQIVYIYLCRHCLDYMNSFNPNDILKIYNHKPQKDE